MSQKNEKLFRKASKLFKVKTKIIKRNWNKLDDNHKFFYRKTIEFEYKNL